VPYRPAVRVLAGALTLLLMLMCLRAAAPVNHLAAALIGMGAGLIFAAVVMRQRAVRRKRPETVPLLRALIGLGLFALAAALAWVQRPGVDTTFAVALVAGLILAEATPDRSRA
jgi:uncharacterized membrane protein